MRKSCTLSAPAPAAEETADAAPARLPHIEQDIASVFLARLEGLFSLEALGLDREPPRSGSFLARVGTTEFWACALCRKDQLRDSAATRFYLQCLFPEQAGMHFHDYCQIWGQSFYAARHDFSSARDILLLFLDQNLVHLKRLYILAQPHNQDLTPDARVLERRFDAPDNAMLFVGERFSRWVLDEWLPFQLRYVCCRQFLANESVSGCICLLEAPANVPVTIN